MRIRTLLPCLLALALGPSAASAAGLEIVRVIHGYKTTESFTRISEYFNGKENTGGTTVIRTQPAVRDGYYFTLRTKTAVAHEVAWVELKIITPASPEPRIESFAVSLPAGSHPIQLGLTGTDWVGRDTHPVAWQIRVLAVDGTELASQQSFLWSMPPTLTVAAAP